MSEGYFDRVLVYNGTRNIDEVLAEAAAKDDHMYATGAYGLAVYEEYVLGNREKAKEILTRIAGRDETWGGFAEARRCRSAEALGRRSRTINMNHKGLERP